MKTLLGLMMAALAWTSAAQGAPISRDPYSGAIVIDAADGRVLFEDGADRPGYPASMLKLMDLFVIFDRLEAGQLRLDETVPVTKEAMRMGGSQVYLDVRESFPVEELIYALTVQSANDAAVALAVHVAGSRDGFVRMMNDKARELGLSPVTRFQSPHGLPPGAGQRPDITTPRDFAKLCKALLDAHPQVLKYTAETFRVFREDPLFEMRTHNRLLGDVPGCDGLKTGYFRDAGYSIAATAQRNGARVIVVVMGSVDRKGRDATARELIARYLPEARQAPPEPEQPAAAPPARAVEADAAPKDAGEAAAAAVAGAEDVPARSWGKTAGIGLLGVFVVGLLVLAVKRRLLLSR